MQILAGNPSNTGNPFLEGYQAGQGQEMQRDQFAMQQQNQTDNRNDRMDAKRVRNLGIVGELASKVLRSPPEQRQALLDSAKKTVSGIYPDLADDLAWVTVESLPGVANEIQEQLTPYQQQMQDINVRRGQLGIQSDEQTLRAGQQQNDYFSNGGAFGPMSGGGSPQPPAGGGGDYMGTLVGQESGGNPLARNPNSSATGLGQFITPTWNGLVGSPEGQAAGLTPDGRTDPNQSKAGLEIFTRQNAAQLQNAGIPTNGKTLYLAHFLGADGAIKALNSDPNASAASIFPDAAASNKSVFYDNGRPRTVQEVVQLQTAKFSADPVDLGGVGAGNGVGVGAPAPQPPQQAPNALLANPEPTPAPQAPAQPPAAPAPAQSIVDLVQSDPKMQELQQRMIRAQRRGDEVGAKQIGGLMDARQKELAGSLPPVLAPKDAAKAAKDEAKSQRADAAVVDNARTVISKVDEALKQTDGYWKTGTSGSVMGMIPGTGAYDLDSTVQTIKSNLSVEALQTMRANSPTGGAMGGVSDKDIQLLGSLVANLSLGQSEDQFKKNLSEIRSRYQKIVDAAEQDARNFGGQASDAAPDTGAGDDLDALLGKYR